MIDWTTLINWFVFYVVFPLIVAIAGTLVTNLIQGRRERERLRQELQNSIELAKVQMRQELVQRQEDVVRSEILPTIWAMMNKAMVETTHLMHPELQVPLGTMSDVEVKRYLDASSLTDSEKQVVLHADDRAAQFATLQSRQRIDNASDAHKEFLHYFMLNKFRISDELYSLLDQVNDCLLAAFKGAAIALTIGNSEVLPSVKQDFLTGMAILAPQIEKQIRQQRNS